MEKVRIQHQLEEALVLPGPLTQRSRAAAFNHTVYSCMERPHYLPVQVCQHASWQRGLRDGKAPDQSATAWTWSDDEQLGVRFTRPTFFFFYLEGSSIKAMLAE